MQKFQVQLSIDARNYVAGQLSDSGTGASASGKGTKKQQSVSPNHSGLTKDGTKDEISLVGTDSQIDAAGGRGPRVHEETPRSQSEDPRVELTMQM